MPTEDAFAVLVQLLTHYHLRFLFTVGMEGVHIRMNQLEMLIKEYLPALYNHFLQLDLKAVMFASSWFLTLFATDLPLDPVFRIFDMVLFEGSSVLFNFSLALLKRSQADLLTLSFEHTLEHLKEKLYEKFSGSDDLVEEALKFKIPSKKLERLEKEAREIFGAKSQEEKLIHGLTQEKAQLEAEIETYRGMYTETLQKNKQLETGSGVFHDECEELQRERQELVAQLHELKKDLSEDQLRMYTNLEQQLQTYKKECYKFQARQIELETELISTKLKYALAESERQRLLLRSRSPSRSFSQSSKAAGRVSQDSE